MYRQAPLLFNYAAWELSLTEVRSLGARGATGGTVLLCQDARIRPSDIHEAGPRPLDGSSEPGAFLSLERAHILRALVACNWVVYGEAGASPVCWRSTLRSCAPACAITDSRRRRLPDNPSGYVC